MTHSQHAERCESGGAETPLPVGAPPRRHPLLRLVPLAVILLVPLLTFGFGLQDRLSLDALRTYGGRLQDLVAEEALLAALAYFALYIAVAAFSIPGAGVLTVAGGFMFGALLGTLLAAAAATIGASIVFLIARTSAGPLLAARGGPRVRRLREGFQADGFSYLLFLRLVPLFPFWLVNLAAALFGLRLLPYVAATAVGILPATFVFAYFGRGLASALESDVPHVPIELLLALTLLGLLALVPAFVRRRRAAGGRNGSD